MKNSNKLYLVLILTLLGIYNALGQQKAMSNPTFSGHFSYKMKKLPDSISILIFPNGLLKPQIDFSVKVDASGMFHFKLPKINKPLLFIIQPVSSGKGTNYGDYYAESTDNVEIEFLEKNSKDSAIFSGRGSSKYNLTENIIKLSENMRKEIPNGLPLSNSASLQVDLKKSDSLFKAYSLIKDRLIRGSDPKMNTDIKELISFEHANLYNVWTTHINHLYFEKVKNQIDLQAIVKNHYNVNADVFFTPPTELSIFCPRYYIGVTEKLLTKLRLNNINNEANMVSYYNVIKNSYVGVIQERLITEFFTNGSTFAYTSNYDPSVYDSLVNDATASMNSSVLKDALLIKTKLKKGSKLYITDFIDLKGRPFNTSSLYGKVFLLDIWGEGCGGCAFFHDTFEKEVMPSLNSRKDFDVVSICVDTKRDRWLRGINSGKLSSPDYINLSTGDSGIDHPFLKHYNIRAIPFLLLVDKKGLIIAKFEIGVNSKDLINIINRETTIENSK